MISWRRCAVFGSVDSIISSQSDSEAPRLFVTREIFMHCRLEAPSWLVGGSGASGQSHPSWLVARSTIRRVHSRATLYHQRWLCLIDDDDDGGQLALACHPQLFLVFGSPSLRLFKSLVKHWNDKQGKRCISLLFSVWSLIMDDNQLRDRLFLASGILQ